MRKTKTKIDSELQIKATAALRNEVIEELTQPDRPMSFLMEELDETKNYEQDCIRTSETTQR
jgi:hypothetical protein